MKKLGIMFYWCCFNTLLFAFISELAPWWFACNVAMIVTVASFHHESNWKDQQALTRPEIWVKDNGR